VTKRRRGGGGSLWRGCYRNKQIKYNNDEINVINAIAIENDDIKKRECNVIISGLANSTGDNIEKDDETKIENLFAAISFEKTKMKRSKRFTNEKNNGKQENYIRSSWLGN
jgi:hypothetical protein